MDKIWNKNQKLILNIIYSSFVFSLVYILALGAGLKLNIMVQILGVFLGSMIVKFFLFNPLILYILLILAILIVVLVDYYITPILPSIMEKTIYLFENIANNLQGKENIASDNLIYFWIILMVFVSLFTSFILFKRKSIYLLLPVYLSSFIYYWYIFFDEAYWMISIFLLFFFILMGLNKYLKGRPDIEYSTNYNFEGLYTPWLKTTTIYSVLIVSLALLLPKTNEYIYWPWLHEKTYSVFPGIADLRSYDNFARESGKTSLFDFSISEYQASNSRLGGPINLNDTKIMTVRSDSSVYLRGNVKHIYNGSSWRSIIFPHKKSPLKQDFSGLPGKSKRTYYEEIAISITNESFASSTIFSPYKPSSIHFKGTDMLEVSRDDILFLSSGIYSGESYTVIAQRPLPYGVLKSLDISNSKGDIKDLELYLQLPDHLITTRTKDLLKEIIKDANNDFEKAIAIEKYLRDNYPYNLEVNEVPDDTEFIDYFLFEEKSGYCTYYATAMAILLRLEGIPTRYVEGYLVQDSVEKGIYEVTNKNAHAWVEVFIEPVGWTLFEPTPIYSIESRLEDYEPNPQEDIIHTDIINEDTIIPGIGLENGPTIEDEGAIIDEGGNPDYLYEDMTPPLSENTLIIFIIVFLAIILIRILIGLFLHIYEDYKNKKLSNNNKIIQLYKQILQITELLGYPQEYGETHFEYANRIAYKFYTHDDKGIIEITDIFVRSKYSTSPSSDEDVITLVEHKQILEKRLKGYLGWLTYYYNKYMKIH